MTKKPAPRRRRRRGSSRSQTPAGGSRLVPLFKRVASHFEPGDRQRGEELYKSDPVAFEIDGTRVRARVPGTERDTYAVGLDWSRVPEERILHAFCECQRFADGHACKHVWATLLTLGDGGPETQPPGKDRLKFRKDRGSAWTDLGLAGDDNGPEGRANERARPSRPAPRRRGRDRGGRDGGAEAWRAQLAALREEVESRASRNGGSRRELGDEMRFLVNTAASERQDGIVIDLFEARPGGKWRRAGATTEDLERWLAELPEGAPDVAVGVLSALPAETPPRAGRGRRGPGGGRGRVERFHLPATLAPVVLARLADRGVLGWWDGRSPGDARPLSWEEGEPWHLALRVEMTGSGAARLNGTLERGEQSVGLDAPAALLPLEGPAAGPLRGLVIVRDAMAPLELSPQRDLPWISLLREVGEIAIPGEDVGEAVTELLRLPDLPPLETPDGLEFSPVEAPPQPRLVLQPDPAPAWMNPPLRAELSFSYGEVRVDAGDPRAAVLDVEEGRLVQRDMEREREALVRLLQLPLKPVGSANGHGLELDPRELPAVAEPLLAEGWDVEVHGHSLRPPGPPAFRIESGIDWFEVKGGVDFAGDHVEMKDVLAAVSRGDRFVKLSDGSQGLLPASWLQTYDSLGKLAHESSEEGLRFLPSQALLVDALLAATPPSSVDPEFKELREKLRSFDRVKPKKEPRSFKGTLRGYQRDGLGWLAFLREFGLGGVLADDMGLGKTVQVLALVRAHRTASTTSGLPWLVVAPRSLVYNWLDEAARFTPDLKVTEYHGADREELQGKLAQFDLVVTTYGTLRRDIAFLAKVDFDTVILDEAQAIKNPESQTAKASRLLSARHRLALTGTPIENHLGELGSIFEFLNPGLMGRLPKLDVLASGGAPSQQQLALVAQGIRPFILRRTKRQVLQDLPPKTEQVLLCDLTEKQRELYDRVRAGYQASLLEQVAAKGIGGSTMQVLEALLRLRQIACHPGLVDEEWTDAGSAKLDTLFDQVDEVLEEGHKVLVFSQFTSLLGFVRKRLDGKGIPYAYLDGQTRDRGEVVERFQNDPKTNLFLISLKAGGVGLNLTAAGYVFLLDPWWNPAVEAQAIDRAHRIGQTQPVFAYRMIARDTVEEKIVELQRTKRQLAETVLEGEGLPVSELTAEDLRSLLT